MLDRERIADLGMDLANISATVKHATIWQFC